MSDVSRRLNDSSHDFMHIVWPELGQGFGRVIPVESVSDNVFASELDRRSGVDVWLIGTDEHMRGLASRVQWTNNSFDTFTVRVRSSGGGSTEYDKRRAAIAANRNGIAGVLYPHYTAQGYVSTDRTRLVAAAIARTQDVISCVEQDQGWLMPPNRDGSQGYAVPWSALRSSRFQIRIWTPRREAA